MQQGIQAILVVYVGGETEMNNREVFHSKLVKEMKTDYWVLMNNREHKEGEITWDKVVRTIK